MGEVLRRDHVGRINLDTAAQASLKQRLEEERAAALARLQLQVPDEVKKRKVLKMKPKKDVESYRMVQTQCLCQQSPEGVPLEVEPILFEAQEEK